jgi:hypothetical protein
MEEGLPLLVEEVTAVPPAPTATLYAVPLEKDALPVT